MALPGSVDASRLGLSSDEIATLQRHQQVALSNAGSSSSRAASAASSQGRLLLDPTSLSVLAAHFDRVMAAIQQRLALLNQQTQIAAARQTQLAQMTAAQADAEIARFRAILRQIDELENEFAKIRRIREIVRSFRARVDALARRVG
ncbi:hypothetical protein BDZ85DRAFT_277134 [Elsinoe ampelina]|uniref:Biogenesis of lysosome-related organelles complex 1 subunit CNL1 n=1 Tax=Elsinoe ampelina TaxID=302913 RepID=A0A6A6GNH8_9PEZI|nr:hypothetical protein BDZ85DRAFT_277134 [Elsinoe ampelina]